MVKRLKRQNYVENVRIFLEIFLFKGEVLFFQSLF